MATKLLFQRDSYLREFEADITFADSETRGLLLNQTAFYPGGGGQQPDRGEIEAGGITYPITEIKRTPDGPQHILGGEAPLPVAGMHIQGRLDWSTRYANMRTHTAMHILCGVVFRDYGALVTGGEMEPLKGRMDFEFETLEKELITTIEKSVQKEVALARQIQVRIIPREEAFAIPDLIRTKINLLPEGISEVRIVEICGLDLQADGGTHVCSTAEVGQMHIVDYKSKGRINKRIYVELE